MGTRIFNLILALGAVLVTFSAVMNEIRGWNVELLIYIVVAPCWLASAIGLFFRSSLAWCGSMLGAATVVCSSVAMIGWGIIVAPAAHDPTDGAGYAIITGVCCLVASLPAIVGLLKMRCHLRGKHESVALSNN